MITLHNATKSQTNQMSVKIEFVNSKYINFKKALQSEFSLLNIDRNLTI